MNTQKEKLPALHLYPGDWLKDDIAGCTLEAQGLWLRMMLIMHESERYGYLCRDGMATPPGSIARRCGCTLDQYMTLLTELFSAGIPSKTTDGIIYSRRMVRDAELRKKRARAGRIGMKNRYDSANNKHPNKTVTNTEYENEDDMKVKYLDYVYLTKTEYDNLCAKFTESGAKDRIEALNLGIGSKGYEYKSHYMAILNWERMKLKGDNNGKAKNSVAGVKTSAGVWDNQYD